MGRNLQSMWGSVLALVKECLSVRRNLIVFHWQCLNLLTPATNQWKWFVSLPLAVAACMRMLFTFVTSYISWVLANIITGSLFCFWICDGNSGCRFCRSFCPKFWADCSRLIYTHCGELMKSVVSDGSLSLPWLQCRLRWWSETLWVALMRLWAQLLLCYLQTVLWRFLCNLIDMWLFLIVNFWISSTLVAVLLLSQDNFFLHWVLCRCLTMLHWCGEVIALLQPRPGSHRLQGQCHSLLWMIKKVCEQRLNIAYIAFTCWLR